MAIIVLFPKEQGENIQVVLDNNLIKFFTKVSVFDELPSEYKTFTLAIETVSVTTFCRFKEFYIIYNRDCLNISKLCVTVESWRGKCYGETSEVLKNIDIIYEDLESAKRLGCRELMRYYIALIAKVYDGDLNSMNTLFC